jgi:glycerophosphoryl diester phosphodiesterase
MNQAATPDETRPRKRIATAVVTALLLLGGFPAASLASDDYSTVAHRGERIATTENSLKALDFAMRNGAAAVETDVRITRDGALIIMHNRAVTRTSHCTGLVAQLTLSRVTSYRCRLNNGERIPTLDQFLARAHANGLNVDIEIMTDPRKRWRAAGFYKVRRRVSSNTLEARVRVSSFSAAYRRRARAKGFYSMLLGVHDYTPAYVASVATAVRYPTGLITAQKVSAFHAANIEIFCRMTDDVAVRNACKAAGVDDYWIDVADVPGLVRWWRNSQA